MNWKIGKFNSVVVSDEKVKNTNFPVPPNSPESKDDEKKYYGGYLICESVASKELAQLISAAPDMLKALNSLVLSVAAHPDYTGEENEEWTDLISIANEAIHKAKGL